jgi:hypothetical protein
VLILFTVGFTLISAGVLCGGPGGGAILGANVQNLHWTGVWVYAGITTIAAGCIFTVLRFIKVGAKIKVKV